MAWICWKDFFEVTLKTRRNPCNTEINLFKQCCLQENSNYLAHPFGVVHPSSLRCWAFVHNKYIHTFLKARIITNSNYLHRIISLSHIYQFFFYFFKGNIQTHNFTLLPMCGPAWDFRGHIYLEMCTLPLEKFSQSDSSCILRPFHAIFMNQLEKFICLTVSKIIVHSIKLIS